MSKNQNSNQSNRQNPSRKPTSSTDKKTPHSNKPNTGRTSQNSGRPQIESDEE
ncbi:MAG: hypothetical protein HUU57_14285 [Bdellovibrio sp.]|nr:hypothetical protein [Bdellovibrio sp.]